MVALSLAPFAIAGIIGLAVHKLRGGGGRKRTMTGIAMPASARHARTQTVFGTARKFRTTVTSLADDTQVLIEHAVVRDRKGGVLLRRAEHAPFLLETVDGAQVLATFHFPNRRNHAVFFNGLISNVFRILIARWCGISLSHKFNDAPVRLVERILA